jgi:hypothetical protein
MADNRRNFLTKPGEQITRPQFALKPSKPKKRSERTVQEPLSVPQPPPPPEGGGPTDEAKKLIGDVRFSRCSTIGRWYWYVVAWYATSIFAGYVKMNGTGLI